MNIVQQIEAYLDKYMFFDEPGTGTKLALALWSIGTYLFNEFTAYPYLCITKETKRSGGTRLMELLSFVSANPLNSGAMTAAGLYEAINGNGDPLAPTPRKPAPPTVFIDEAENLSTEAATTMRALLNMGYRKGSIIRRFGDKEYKTYCPKAFTLIGDVYDTLRDRSIVVRLVRGTPRERFVYEPVKAEGHAIRESLTSLLLLARENIQSDYLSFRGLPFLTDRDEEIWTPLFVIATVICPPRLEELRMLAVDMSTEKTQRARRYTALKDREEAAQDDEYARRLLQDVHAVMQAAHVQAMSSADLVAALRTMPTSPWRRYQGDGLTMQSLADMLARFQGVAPKVVRIGRGRKHSKTYRAYRLKDIDNAMAAVYQPGTVEHF